MVTQSILEVFTYFQWYLFQVSKNEKTTMFHPYFNSLTFLVRWHILIKTEGALFEWKKQIIKFVKWLQPCQIIITINIWSFKILNCSFHHPKEMIWMGISHLSFKKGKEKKRRKENLIFMYDQRYLHFSFSLRGWLSLMKS